MAANHCNRRLFQQLIFPWRCRKCLHLDPPRWMRRGRRIGKVKLWPKMRKGQVEASRRQPRNEKEIAARLRQGACLLPLLEFTLSLSYLIPRNKKEWSSPRGSKYALVKEVPFVTEEIQLKASFQVYIDWREVDGWQEIFTTPQDWWPLTETLGTTTNYRIIWQERKNPSQSSGLPK